VLILHFRLFLSVGTVWRDPQQTDSTSSSQMLISRVRVSPPQRVCDFPSFQSTFSEIPTEFRNQQKFDAKITHDFYRVDQKKMNERRSKRNLCFEYFSDEKRVARQIDRDHLIVVARNCPFLKDGELIFRLKSILRFAYQMQLTNHIKQIM
jgi:hypothetical protein